ncbi:MAG: hypothetical protein LBG80_18500 [Bacteroidales bacterium]|nr:hypothetical protein [Bacteroidales bacterium]
MLIRKSIKDLYIKSSVLEASKISEIQNNKEGILKRWYFLPNGFDLWRTIRMNKITQTNHSSDKKNIPSYITDKELCNNKTKE